MSAATHPADTASDADVIEERRRELRLATAAMKTAVGSAEHELDVLERCQETGGRVHGRGAREYLSRAADALRRAQRVDLAEGVPE